MKSIINYLVNPVEIIKFPLGHCSHYKKSDKSSCILFCAILFDIVPNYSINDTVRTQCSRSNRCDQKCIGI